MAPTAKRGSNGRGPRVRHSVAVLLLAVVISLAGAVRPAEAVSATEIAAATYDVMLLRPVNAIALVLGSVFFVASVPFVAPFVGVRNAWDVFVYAPYEYTFERDIGDF